MTNKKIPHINSKNQRRYLAYSKIYGMNFTSATFFMFARGLPGSDAIFGGEIWNAIKFRVPELIEILGQKYPDGRIPHANFVEEFAKVSSKKSSMLSKLLKHIVSFFDERQKTMTLEEIMTKVIKALCSDGNVFEGQAREFLKDVNARKTLLRVFADALYLSMEQPKQHVTTVFARYSKELFDVFDSIPGLILKKILPAIIIVYTVLTMAAVYSPVAFKATLRLITSTTSASWWAMKQIMAASKTAFGITKKKTSLPTQTLTFGVHRPTQQSQEQQRLIDKLLGSRDDPAPTHLFDPARPCGADSHLDARGYDRAKIMAVAARMGIGTSRKKTVTQLCEEVREKYFELIAAAEARAVQDDVVLKVQVAHAKRNNDAAS